MMKKSRFSESQIISILNQYEKGMKVHDICREHGISDATLQLRAKYRGLNERLNGTIRTELLNAFVFKSIEQVRQKVDQ